MARYAVFIILVCAVLISGAFLGYYYRTVSNLRDEVRGLKERVRTLERENTAYRKRIADLHGREYDVSEFEDRIGAMRKERDNIKSEFDELHKRSTALERILKEREEEIKKRDSRIEDLKKEIENLAQGIEQAPPEPKNRTMTLAMQEHINDLLQRYDFTALERLGEVAVPAFLDLLNEGLPAYRQRAAFSLGVIRDGSAVGPLTPLLDDTVAFVAIEAARALGKIGDPTAEDALINVLYKDHDRYWEVQRESLIALRKLNSVKGISALINMSGSGRFGLQYEANASLRRITFHYIKDPNLDALPSNWSAWWKKHEKDFRNVKLKGQENWKDGNPLLKDGE